MLIVGCADDLDDVGITLALLPPDAYGQVLIEAPADATDCLTAPPRVAIHRVDPGRAGLEAAVSAWVEEWIPWEPDPRRAVAVWVGRQAGAVVDLDHLDLDHLTV